MDHILDNMIWNALITGNNDIAIINGEVGCYLPDIAPFAGMKDFNNANLKKLYEFIPINRSVAISSLNKMDHDESRWKLLQPIDVTQMVYEHSVKTFTTKNSSLIVPLSEEHVPQMIELTALTRPGPFLQQTIRFKNYFGIFIEDRLAAMAGQRMHPRPYMEVSAVCTHPDFRGARLAVRNELGGGHAIDGSGPDFGRRLRLGERPIDPVDGGGGRSADSASVQLGGLEGLGRGRLAGRDAA
jgi:hypothetical protein